MIVTLPAGLSQNWGSQVLINITGAIAPAETNGYQVLIRATRITDMAIVCMQWVLPSTNGAISFDLSPYIPSTGAYRVEFGEGYYPVIIDGYLGDWQGAMLPALTVNVQIVNAVIIETASYTIPGGAVQLSGNPVVVEVKTVAADMVGKANYKRALKVTCLALIGNPMIEEIVPDTNLGAIFNISGLVDQPAEYAFAFPAVGVVADHRALELNVALDVGEIYIDATGARVVAWKALAAATNSIRILKGFLRPYELAKLAEIGSNFNSEYINKGRFLTHLPDRQMVTPTQIAKLWYLSKYPGYVEAEWHCKVNQMTNYGPQTFNTLKGDVMLDPNSGLLEFNINPKFMGHKASVTEQYPIFWYSFWLTKKIDNSVISEVRTYMVDNDYHDHNFYFYYVNPLSGIDCIWLHGEHSESLKTEKETAFRPVPFGSETKVPNLKTTSASGQRSWELNTGYKTKEEIIALRDFLESRECWMVDNDQPSRLIPVIVEAGDYLMYDSMPEFLPNLGIKIMEANK